MHQLQANEILLTQQNKLSQNTYISISISFFFYCPDPYRKTEGSGRIT